MKKNILIILITFLVSSTMYMVVFRLLAGEPQRSISYNIYQEVQDSWLSKITRFIPREDKKHINIKTIEQFNEHKLVSVNHLIVPSADDYYLVINENENEWLLLRHDNKIDLPVFNYYNYLREGYITRELVVEKFCNLYAYQYENRDEGSRIPVKNKSDVDSIYHLFGGKSHIAEIEVILKNFNFIGQEVKIIQNSYTLFYWYYCGGICKFEFLFQENSIDLEKVTITKIGDLGIECMLF